MTTGRMPAPGPSGGLSNLQTRVLSAVVLIAIVLPVTWYGGLAFRVLCAAIGAAILFEWLRMSSAVARDHKIILGLMLAGVLGLLVIAIPALYVLLALASGVAAAAAFARVRGPKLAPAISPGKTWSGAIGGTAGGIAAGMAVAWYVGFADFATVLICLILSVVGQVGDLFESSVKRRHGTKDSSNLIPGHGGVMDRVDALVAAAFAFYVIGALSGGLDQPAHGLIPV